MLESILAVLEAIAVRVADARKAARGDVRTCERGVDAVGRYKNNDFKMIKG